MSTKTNDIIKILENQIIERDRQAELKIFGLSQLSRLNKLVEKENYYITSSLWDLLLFNVNDLYINENGTICYKSLSKPSKRIIKFFLQFNDIIVDNINYIMTGKNN